MDAGEDPPENNGLSDFGKVRRSNRDDVTFTVGCLTDYSLIVLLQVHCYCDVFYMTCVKKKKLWVKQSSMSDTSSSYEQLRVLLPDNID